MLCLPVFFLEVRLLPRGGRDAFNSRKMCHTVSLKGALSHKDNVCAMKILAANVPADIT